MVLPDPTSRPAGAHGGDPSAARESGGSEAEFELLIARLRDEVRGAGADLRHLAHVRLLRLELEARRLARRSFAFAAARLGVTLLALVAGVLVLLGLAGFVAELGGGRLWLGRLVVGALALAGSAWFLRSSGPSVEELRERLSSTAPDSGGESGGGRGASQ